MHYKIFINKKTPMKIILTESQYNKLKTHINEVRQAPEAEDLTGMLSAHKDAEYLAVFQRLKSGEDTPYYFKIKIMPSLENSEITDINKVGKTINKNTHFNPGTVLYGTKFQLNFDKGLARVINNVTSVSIYKDLDSMKNDKPLAVHHTEHEMDTDVNQLAKDYTYMIETSRTNDVIYLDFLKKWKNKLNWDGVITRKNNDNIEIELETDDKTHPYYVIIRNDAFKINNDILTITFQAKKIDSKGELETFTNEIKSFKIINKSKSKTPEEKTDDENSSDEDSMKGFNNKKDSDRKSARIKKMFLDNPELLADVKRFYYKKPGVLKQIMNILFNKDLRGKGLLSAENSLRRFNLSSRVTKTLGEDVENFVELKNASFSVIDEPIVVKMGEEEFILPVNDKLTAIVNKTQFDDTTITLTSNNKNGKYLIVLLSPLKGEDKNDMFNVKIVKRVKVNDEIKNYSGKGIIKFYKSDGYNPTKDSVKK